MGAFERMQALAWWRRLTEKQQNDLAAHYYPNTPAVLITTSSQKIETIWSILERDK